MRSADTMAMERDRWSREIELQKSFGLTPSEASIFTARESGESVADIASSMGLNLQTVKNTLSNARRKLNRGTEMEIYIIKPTQNNDSSMYRMEVINVMVQLMSRITDAKIDDLTHIVKISGMDRGSPGDYTWMNANVFRYIDPLGMKGRDMPDERAERMTSLYKQKIAEQGVTGPMMGFSVLRYWLDKYFVQYDIIEV